MSIFARIDTGDIKPRGSYSYAISDSTVLFVIVRFVEGQEANRKVSSEGCQHRLRILIREGSISTGAVWSCDDVGK